MTVTKLKVRKMPKIDGIRTPLVSRLIGVKIQCGYEGLAQTMFATQSDAMIKELVKEMIKTVGK